MDRQDAEVAREHEQVLVAIALPYYPRVPSFPWHETSVHAVINGDNGPFAAQTTAIGSLCAKTHVEHRPPILTSGSCHLPYKAEPTRTSVAPSSTAIS